VEGVEESSTSGTSSKESRDEITDGSRTGLVDPEEGWEGALVATKYARFFLICSGTRSAVTYTID